MRGTTEGGGARRRRALSSPTTTTGEQRRRALEPSATPRASYSSIPSVGSVLAGADEYDEEEEDGIIVGGGGGWSSSSNNNPRSFPHSVKQQCWNKAEKIKGRDPDRWRRDPLGNVVFRKLVGCPGCLCHDYDHILPFSKGGKSTLENCQVLQATVNRSKGNRTEVSKADLIQKSAYCRVSGRDMDLLELSAFGNVHRGQDSGGCNIQ